MTGRRKQKLTIYLDPVQDAAILDWLSGQENQSGAIRRVLKAALESGHSSNGCALDWGELRAVVERAVQTALAGLAVTPALPPDVITRDEPDESFADLIGSLLVE